MDVGSTTSLPKEQTSKKCIWTIWSPVSYPSRMHDPFAKLLPELRSFHCMHSLPGISYPLPTHCRSAVASYRCQIDGMVWLPRALPLSQSVDCVLCLLGGGGVISVYCRPLHHLLLELELPVTACYLRPDLQGGEGGRAEEV